MGLFTRLAETVVGSNAVNPGWLRTWMTEVERLFTSAVYAERIYGALADLDADLAHDANSGAIVMGDSAAHDGVYRKTGVSGSGEWIRVGDLPGRGFVVASDDGGTANAIEAVTALPVNGSELITVPIVQTNTAAGPTVSFNGGPALAIATSAGNPVFEGGLPADSEITGRIDGSVFRLLSDQAAAAIQAASEAAAVEALGYRNDAQQAAADAATTAGQAVFANRNATNAAICAGFTDNTRCRMGDLDYVVDSAATGTASATNDLGVDGLRPAGIATVDHFGPDSGALARALLAVDYVEGQRGSTYSIASSVDVGPGKTVRIPLGCTLGVDSGYTDDYAINLQSNSRFILDGACDGANLLQPTADWLGVGHPKGVFFSSVGASSGSPNENVQWYSQAGSGEVRNCPSGACWFKWFRDPVVYGLKAKDCQSSPSYALNAVFDFFDGEGGDLRDFEIENFKFKGVEVSNSVSTLVTGRIRGSGAASSGFATLAFGSGSENCGFPGSILLQGPGGTAVKVDLGESWVIGDVVARSPSHAAVILQSVSGCTVQSITCVSGTRQALYIQALDTEQQVSAVKVGSVTSRRGSAATTSNQTAVVLLSDTDAFNCDGVEIETITSLNDWTGLWLINDSNTRNVRIGTLDIEGNVSYAIIAYAQELFIKHLYLRPTASAGTGAQCYFANTSGATNPKLIIEQIVSENVNSADDLINFDTSSSWIFVEFKSIFLSGGAKCIELETSSKVSRLTLGDVTVLGATDTNVIHLKIATDAMYVYCNSAWLITSASQYNFRFDESSGGLFYGYVESNSNCDFAVGLLGGRPANITP